MRDEASVWAAELAGLDKTYLAAGTRLPVLRNVNLQVRQGGFIALLGPSGCGKSTILNLLAGLEAPDGGSVRVMGQVPGQQRSPIAYMQQKDLLLPWRSVLRNALLGPELQGPEALRAAEPLAADLLQRFGLERFAGSYPAELSGGMRQRVALIRTLLCQQPILLLDEPFSALDAITRRRLQAHLLDVWRSFGKTIVEVTHDIDEALLLAERIVLMSGQPGRIVREVEVQIPHEQRAASPELLRMKNEILDWLEAEDAAA